MALPNTYRQIEYLQSTGTQCIRVGNSWSSNYKTEAVVQATGKLDVFYGIRNTSNYRYGLWFRNTHFGGTTGDYSVITETNLPIGTNKHNVTLYNGTLTVDGTSSSVSNYSNISYSNGITLFGYCLDSDSNYYAFSSIALYSFKAYSGATLIYDLVPVVRISDNKPGMYDLVNNVFYTNQGTGEFKVPEGTGKVKRIYVGDKLIYPMWKVNDNTLLYIPLESDALDRSSNAISTSPTNITYANLGGVKCANANGSSSKIQLSNTSFLPSNATEGTISMLVYGTARTSSTKNAFELASSNARCVFGFNTGGDRFFASGYGTTNTSPSLMPINNWHLMTLTFDSTNCFKYINGELIAIDNRNSETSPRGRSPDVTGYYLFCNRSANTSWWSGGGREFIIENRKWDAAEVEAYNRYIRQKLGIS